ncbi:MAG TPA: hypothetical protein ACFE0H_08180 [Elainellaceae cyanobacterium]|jgi:hypothetical protein
MNTIAPEKRQLILTSDQDKLPEILVYAAIRDEFMLQNLFNLIRDIKKISTGIEIVIKKTKSIIEKIKSTEKHSSTPFL